MSDMSWSALSAAATKRAEAMLKDIRAQKEAEPVRASVSVPTAEDVKWRRLTGNDTRDLVPVAHERMIEIAYWLWETNPLAGWLIDIMTAFITAEGLPYAATDEAVKAVLDAFWNDPVNRLPLNFPKLVDSLHIFGEICIPVFTAKQTGRVRHGYVDPARIDQVITDPENVAVTIGIVTKPWTGLIGTVSVEVPQRLYRTVLPEDADYVLSPQARSLRERFTDGECHFWAINNVINSPRGRSSFLSTADWLDAYEQFLFDYADKWPLQNSFIWDLKVDGANSDEIKEQIATFTKKSGSIFGHNEKVELNAVTPDLKALDAQAGARLFRNHILGRFGFPEHWYGGGGDVNRATAAEMDAPALKLLARRQLTVKYILEDMLAYAIRQARAARYLRVTDDAAAAFSVVTPQMQDKDASKLGSAAQQIAAALLTAELQGWVDKDTARKIFASIVTFTGVDIDLEDVKRKVEEEDASSGYEDYRKKRPVKAELKVVPE